MQCSKCKGDAIVYQPYSGQYLCRDHLVTDIEVKAKRTLRQQKGMRPGDHIAVFLSGSAADSALLFFLRKLVGKRKDIRVSGIPVDAGTGDFAAMARYKGVTRTALATTLEDASALILTDILQGWPGRSHEIACITPFCHIPAEEIAAYARIQGITGDKVTVHDEGDALYNDVKALLADYSSRHPAAPYAVLNLNETLAQKCADTGGETTHGA